MKRTKQPNLQTNEINEMQVLQSRLQFLSDLSTRMSLMGSLGTSHNGQRDLWKILGYPNDVVSSDFLKQWKRGDLARAIIDKPITATWQGPVTITEPEQEEQTELELAYEALDRKLFLKNKMKRADRLSELGKYSIILLGFDDSTAETWRQPVSEGQRTLKYIRVVSEANAEVTTWEEDPSDERYGYPRLYSIKLHKPGQKDTVDMITVHYSRVIHITPTLLEDEIEGVPLIETIYNRLIDIEKLAGGSAEMFWRGARPGYSGKAQEGYKIGTQAKKDLLKEIEEYENDLKRILVTEGIDLQTLSQQIGDPKNHMQVQLQFVSAITNIPLRILIGSERGELASTQDQNHWKEEITQRRTERISAKIIRPFIDRLIKYGALPEPVGELHEYEVGWSDLFSMSAKDKSEIGKTLSEAITKYISTPEAEATVPLEPFLKYILKMDDDSVAQIIEKRDEFISDLELDEDELFEDEGDEGEGDDATNNA